MSNVSTEQFEFLLSLLGAQAEAQAKQTEALERIAAAIEWQVDANREQADSAWVKVR